MNVAKRLEQAARNGVPVVLDGGLATELEHRGFDLRDRLWSARVLLESPDSIRELHEAYLAAGAECITTSSYQATFAGLTARGLSDSQVKELLVQSVRLAQQARENRSASEAGKAGGREALVAASIGPYGAYLADGSEYRGDYGLTVEQLVEFHSQRFEVLAESGADLLACETIPSILEAEALAKLIEGNEGVSAWLSFACRDEGHLCRGERIEDAAAMLEGIAGVVAIGVNCTAPEFVEGLIARISASTRKPIVVYPNSGQTWDSSLEQWIGDRNVDSFVAMGERWRGAGAAGIGGCCMIGPEHIRRLAAMVGVGQ